MNSRKELDAHWDTLFAQIDATMHTAPEHALTLCKQVFVESYLWEPPVYVRAAERYGKIMDHLGKSAEARDSLFAAQEAARGSCLPIHEAKILERLARTYYSSGDYRRAMQFWTSSVDAIERTGGELETWILAKIGLAQAHKDTGDYAACDAMLAQAQARTSEVGDPHLDAKVRINLAVSLIEQERPDAASALLHEAFNICSEHQLFDYLAESNLYLGKIALHAASTEQALNYFEAGLTHARHVNFRWCEAQLLAATAQVFAGTGRLDVALQTVKRAQAIAIQDGFSDMLTQQHFLAAEYAASMNDFATAYAEYKAGHACEKRVKRIVTE